VDAATRARTAGSAEAYGEDTTCPLRYQDDGIAEDDSLAENDERVGLHPLDQLRAFKLLLTVA